MGQERMSLRSGAACTRGRLEVRVADQHILGLHVVVLGAGQVQHDVDVLERLAVEEVRNVLAGGGGERVEVAKDELRHGLLVVLALLGHGNVALGEVLEVQELIVLGQQLRERARHRDLVPALVANVRLSVAAGKT